MGTNYYFYPIESSLDASIRILEEYNENNIHTKALELLWKARKDERLHIGKSSSGWCFSLHVTDTIRSLEDWKSKWVGGVIVDEYGQEHTPEEMLQIITVRSRPEPVKISPLDPYYKSVEDFLKKNYADFGPKNLLRHKIGPHCCGHGDGTWDLIEGEFS